MKMLKAALFAGLPVTERGNYYWMIILPQVSHSTWVPLRILLRMADGKDVLHPEHWP